MNKHLVIPTRHGVVDFNKRIRYEGEDQTFGCYWGTVVKRDPVMELTNDKLNEVELAYYFRLFSRDLVASKDGSFHTSTPEGQWRWFSESESLFWHWTRHTLGEPIHCGQSSFFKSMLKSILTVPTVSHQYDNVRDVGSLVNERTIPLMKNGRFRSNGILALARKEAKAPIPENCLPKCRNSW